MLSMFKIYAENENEIFDNYYEFREKNAIDPSEDLYLFFYFDSKTPSVITNYFDSNRAFTHTLQSIFTILEDKPKLKRAVYYYYLEVLRKKDIDIEAVIKGDVKNTSYAVALLTSIHADYPKQVWRLFYDFDALVDELMAYFKKMIHKVNLYHTKKKNLYEPIINDFIKSAHINTMKKNYFPNENINFNKQIYAIAFFNRIVIKIFHHKDTDKQISVLIGDGCNNASTSYANYKHITATSASKIFAVEPMNDIVNALLIKGEKSITQLSHILPHSRSTIHKFMELLDEELIVKISRKRGNEIYYEINFEYFIAAQPVVHQAFDKFILEYRNRKKEE